MLTVERLTKKFSNGKGIFDLSFHVQKGEVFGFLGPNGAGKSTTIRHIMGFMKPDQGDIKVNGMDVLKQQGDIQRHIGYLPGEIAFIEGMTGKQFLDFMADMHGLKDTAKRNDLIERLQFDVHYSDQKNVKRNEAKGRDCRRLYAQPRSDYS